MRPRTRAQNAEVHHTVRCRRRQRYGGWRGGPSEGVHELGHDDALRRLRPLTELDLLRPEGRHVVGVLVVEGVVHVATTADPRSRSIGSPASLRSSTADEA
jgi:hypothetical protein